MSSLPSDGFPASSMEAVGNLMVNTQLNPKFMNYVQGIRGWGAGRIEDGVYVEYDGLSGSHIPFFQVAHAFLGLPPYFSEENMLQYIRGLSKSSTAQYTRSDSGIKRCKWEETQIVPELESTIQQPRAFRATHCGRIQW
ncbi:hypothetical protein BJX66DRAFT_345122 [Aspergillus keveii]|uniref:Uncharacterized protein n=1 Tax=Aspergillus keveii TaxID=714993 RepID=A0ABR4FJG6_9EURO